MIMISPDADDFLIKRLMETNEVLNRRLRSLTLRQARIAHRVGLCITWLTFGTVFLLVVLILSEVIEVVK
jgi:hypothetical protein